MLRIVLAAMLVLPIVAVAQVPRTGVAAPPGGAPDGKFTAAPVPSVGSTPGPTEPQGAPGSIPDQVAPSGLQAGPANSTPLSTGGAGQLPSDTAIPTNRDQQGGPAARTPNVSP